jgi:hypothetical protein
MKRCLLLLLGGLCLADTGCEIAFNISRNVVNEPALACTTVHLGIRARRLARQAWEAELARHPGPEPPRDFADGFHDGYVDFLLEGGVGEPPAVPPKRYRAACYANPAGYEAIESYFAGFRQGAAAAIASGQRRFFVVPILLPPEPPPPQMPPPRKDGGTETPGTMTPGSGTVIGGPGGAGGLPPGASVPLGTFVPPPGVSPVPQLPPPRPFP